MRARPSPRDEFVFAALLFRSAIPYSEIDSIFLVEPLGPFLAFASAAAYGVVLYKRAGKARGQDWLALVPVPLKLSVVGAACLVVATAVLITFLGYARLTI